MNARARLLPLLLAAAVAAAPGRVSAYDPATTHAGLTQRAAMASGLHAALVKRFGRPLGLFEPVRFAAASLPDDERRFLKVRLDALDPAGGYRPGDDGVATSMAWLVAGSVIAWTPAERGQNSFYDPSRGRGSAPGRRHPRARAVAAPHVRRRQLARVGDRHRLRPRRPAVDGVGTVGAERRRADHALRPAGAERRRGRSHRAQHRARARAHGDGRRARGAAGCRRASARAQRLPRRLPEPEPVGLARTVQSRLGFRALRRRQLRHRRCAGGGQADRSADGAGVLHRGRFPGAGRSHAAALLLPGDAARGRRRRSRHHAARGAAGGA